MTMVGCKKFDGDNNGEGCDCLNFNFYDQQTTIQDKADWLYKYGRFICPDLLNATAEHTHEIDASIATRLNTTTQTLSWTQIKSLMQNHVYEYYIKCHTDNSGNINLVNAATPYQESGNCFSMPLFRGIHKKYTLNDKDKFEFMSATTGNATTGIKKIVMFSITRYGQTQPFISYDYSDRPDKRKVSTDKKSPL